MSSGVFLLVSLGVVAFVLAFIFQKLGNKEENSNHYVLQILILGFIMVVFALIGKVSIDNSQDCNYNLMNTTVTGNVTVYNHLYQCSANTGNESSAQIFYKWMVRFVYIVGIYLVLYLIYAVLSYFGYLGGGKDSEEQ